MVYMEELEQEWPNIAAAVKEYVAAATKPDSQCKIDCLNLAVALCVSSQGDGSNPLDIAKQFHGWVSGKETV